MIEVREVSKQFGPTRAVQEVSFAAPAAAVTGFLGPNGAGKTTTLRMLLGLATPDAGEALIDGRRYRELPNPRRTVGAVIDGMGFHPGRTGRNHLRVVARAAGVPASRVGEVLEFVELEAAADRKVGGYSQGMRQRLSLATALLGDPPVLVLDEPTNGLDPAGMLWMREQLSTWAAQGRTVLFSSHVLSEVETVADRLVIIDQGRVVRDGTPAELYGTQQSVVAVSIDAEALRTIAEQRGWQARREGPDRLVIHGATPLEVGQAAAGAGIVLSELSTTASGRRLEELFFEITRPDIEAELS